ncbi:cyclase family protein [Candidatus Latescibacterota bacterium]
MSMLNKMTLVGLSHVLVILAFAITVSAADNTGKWGPDDQLGTLNYITPQVRKNAAKLVRSGKVFNVALDIKSNMPTYPGRNYQHNLTIFPSATASEGSGIGVSDDLIIMHQQYSTHWDGFPHFGYDGKFFNDVPVSVVTPQGTHKHSIHLWVDKIVTRGVLLDVAKYKGKEYLEKGYIITSDDLQGTAKTQGVVVKSGDCLLIRTGWIIKLLEQKWPLRGDEMSELGEPGIGYDAAQWLHEKEVACLVMDNTGIEPIPFDPLASEKVLMNRSKSWPMHVEFLVNMGMPLGELFDFEELAVDCSDDGQYEFMFIAPPLRIVGGVGSPLSPVAVK